MARNLDFPSFSFLVHMIRGRMPITQFECSVVTILILSSEVPHTQQIAKKRLGHTLRGRGFKQMERLRLV